MPGLLGLKRVLMGKLNRVKQIVYYVVEIKHRKFKSKFVVERRYKDFEKLWSGLKDQFKCYCIPCLPPKNFLMSLGLKDNGFIEKRAVILSFLLNLLGSDIRLANSTPINEFLFGMTDKADKPNTQPSPSYLTKFYRTITSFTASKLNCEDFFVHSMYIIEQLEKEIEECQIEIKQLQNIVRMSISIFESNNRILAQNAGIMKGTIKNAKYVIKETDLSMNSNLSKFVKFNEQSRIEVVNRNKINEIVVEVR